MGAFWLLCAFSSHTNFFYAGVVELVDAPDSKSGEGNLVRVRVSPPAFFISLSFYSSVKHRRPPANPNSPKPSRQTPVSQQPSLPIQPAITLARRVSFDALMFVEQGDFLDSDVLDGFLQKALREGAGNADHREADRRLAQEITFGVLRWRGWLDHQIARLASRSLQHIEPAVRTALRMGLYQIAFLSRIPESAAVNESVNLIKLQTQLVHLGGFTNAILREALRQGIRFDANAPLPEPTGRNWDELASMVSHPSWLLTHWARQWSPTRAIQIARSDNTIPNFYLWLNPLRAPIDQTRQTLEQAGVQLQTAGNNPQTVHWIEGDFSALWPLVEQGAAYVQDAASQQVARWLGVQPGMRVLDCCAAPGGKTAQLAAQMNNRGELIACDLHPRRVTDLKNNCERLGVTILTTGKVDFSQETLFATAPKYLHLEPAGFDAVLVDAPCSGTGTLRRHPEIKWKLTPQKLPELAELQSRILENAAQAVKPGGVLLYATCSLEEKEGEEVVRRFRNRHPEFELEPPADAGSALTSEKYLRTWPDAGPDGFFGARFRKRK